MRNKKKVSKSTKKATKRIVAKARSVKRKVTRPVVTKARVHTSRKIEKPLTAKTSAKAAPKQIVARAAQKPVVAKAISKAVTQLALPLRKRPRTAPAPRGVRATSPSTPVRRHVVHMARPNQFNYMRAPGIENAFNVGDTVEVFCDHERDGERVRGWIKGIVVQVDNKLVAVQFRSNVFLTDGWMVPDRILWYSLTSDQIREATFAKRGSHKAIPDY